MTHVRQGALRWDIKKGQVDKLNFLHIKDLKNTVKRLKRQGAVPQKFKRRITT